MIWKLSLTGMKTRLRDYMILFSGLAIAAAIFYMFESLATNKEFLEHSNTVSFVSIVFHLGTVLLGIITFVYILYANSFLMTLRQKTYAMLMMLGARTSKIAQMIFIETFVAGIAATVVGMVVGVGLTALVNRLLVNQMRIVVSHYTPFNTSALLVTLIFFIAVFLIASMINASSIVKKSILQLLNEQKTPTRFKRNPFLLFIETVIGLLSLAIGYYVLSEIVKFQIMGLIIALVTIILGSYLIFHSVVIFVISLLKKSNVVVFKKLNNFTLSQLSFRVHDFTQILSMVSILFALALGALTVGLGFRNQIMTFTNTAATYDIVLNNAQKIDQQKINKLDPTLNVTYDQKYDDTTVYYIKEQFDQHPFEQKDQSVFLSREVNDKTLKYDAAKMEQDEQAQKSLQDLELPEQKEKQIKLISQADFDTLGLDESQLQVINVADFTTILPQIKTLIEENEKNNPSLGGAEGQNSFSQKYYVYNLYNTFFSGFEFMGFFLGIAFLTMLASCLMFKILSSANSDTIRYEMLRKIGTRQSLLKRAIFKEIGILFLLPGILGSIHVLFGLQMFKNFLSQPYHNIWIPFTIFIVLYALYYFATIWIYTSIVLPKEKRN
ncbi:FtsX-like permease family protein [Enterococcus sp. AZ102]|uniref:FtsX-like permease family protein n=1 Tax=Enterococcus sp. AZ102 TaxID=2774865 RepID=UPI003F253676